MQDFWTIERIDRLRELWPSTSGTEIAVIMGSSKGAVLGKARRLNLPQKPTPQQNPEEAARSQRRRDERARYLARQAALAPSKPSKPAPPPKPPKAIRVAAPKAAPKPAPTPKVMPILSRTSVRNPCQWPIGHPGRPGFRMCDEPGVIGRPYCSEHCQRAYSKVPTWARDPNRPAGLSAGTNPGKW